MRYFVKLEVKATTNRDEDVSAAIIQAVSEHVSCITTIVDIEVEKEAE